MKKILIGLFAAGAAYGQVALTMTTDNPNPVAGGLFFSYTLTASNTGGTGPMALTNFLAAGIQFLSVSSTSSSLAARVICAGPPIGTSGSITCSSPSFPAGGVATIKIFAQCAPNVSGVLENAAEVIPTMAGQPERVTFLQRIQNQPFLQLFSSATPQVSPGDTIVYNLGVLNGTVSSANSVLVEDALPDGVSFVSVTGTSRFHDACSFQPANNKVECPANDLPVGGGVITIVVKVSDSKKLGTLVNTATLSGTGTIAGSPAITTTAVVK